MDSRRRDFHTKKIKEQSSMITTANINLTKTTNLVKTMESQLIELNKQKQEIESK